MTGLKREPIVIVESTPAVERLAAAIRRARREVAASQSSAPDSERSA